MSEKVMSDKERVVFTSFQLPQKVLRMELVDLLHVAKYDISLATHQLRHIHTLQLGDVVLDDVLQRAGVVTFCLHHLAHDQQDSSATHK